MKYLLTIDIGNTNIDIGLFCNNELESVAKISTKDNKSEFEIASSIVSLLNIENGIKSKILSGIINNDIVYQSHRDCITNLPNGAIELAYNNKGIQAFAINEYIYGVQFHPEFSWEIIKQYVSIRRALGIVVNKLTEPIPNAGQVVLHNFIELIE